MPMFAVQQNQFLCRLRGYQSMYDIIVATPGRLVDHINKTEGFDLTHLRFLVSNPRNLSTLCKIAALGQQKIKSFKAFKIKSVSKLLTVNKYM